MAEMGLTRTRSGCPGSETAKFLQDLLFDVGAIIGPTDRDAQDRQRGDFKDAI